MDNTQFVSSQIIMNGDLNKNGSVEISPRRSEIVAMKYTNFRGSDVTLTTQAGSTLPLVEFSRGTDLDNDYNPFNCRVVEHPTSNMETLIHLLKGSLGTGILSMPLAVLNAGLSFGLVATFAIGMICTYCVQILVKCSHELCRRNRIPSLGFAETAYTAFISGPPSIRKYCRLGRLLTNLFLVLDLLGCCCIYNVFVSKNIKQVVDHYTGSDINIRIYMLFLLPFLLLINSIRNLKLLAPFSMIANILIGTGVTITYYYMLIGLPNPSTRPQFSSFRQLPMFFGTVIFALEGIGVVMPLENNMKNPQDFVGCPGVLNIGMGIVVSLYAATGFLGYLKYGDSTEGSITLNLPNDEILAQSVKVMIAIAIFFTYALQFYVPMQIIWNELSSRFEESKKNAMEYLIRCTLVTATVVMSIAIPNLGPFISLIGAVCLSTLGLMFPAIIDLVTFWEEKSEVKDMEYRVFLYKNLALIAFGLLGFFTGTYVSIVEIMEEL